MEQIKWIYYGERRKLNLGLLFKFSNAFVFGLMNLVMRIKKWKRNFQFKRRKTIGVASL